MRISPTFFSVGIIALLFSFFTLTASAQTSCLQFPSGSTPPSGYGASWDVFDSAKTLLVKTNCPTSGTSLTLTVGRGNNAQYLWGKAYTYNGSSWTEHTLTGTDGTNGWILGTGTKTITAPSTASTNSPFFIAAYMCTDRNGSWKCGCANTSCTQSLWQLQAYTGMGSGTVGPTPGFPEIKECGSTVNVTPSTLGSNLGDGCRTLIMAPGTYSLNINGHSEGVLTLKCSQTQTCIVNTTVEIGTNDGVIIDGIKMTTESVGHGVDITNSQNVIIRNSYFAGAGGHAIAIQNTGADNIQILGNTFIGVEDPDPARPGLLIGKPDYGVAVYESKRVLIKGNTFTGIFNHCVSLKQYNLYSLIEENTFNGCGRTAINLGQNPNATDDPKRAVIHGVVNKNIFKGKAGYGLAIRNIMKAEITNNNFSAASYDNKISIGGYDGNVVGGSGIIGDGTTAGRQVIQSGNTGI